MSVEGRASRWSYCCVHQTSSSPTLLPMRTSRRTDETPSAQGAPLTNWIRIFGGLSQAPVFFKDPQVVALSAKFANCSLH